MHLFHCLLMRRLAASSLTTGTYEPTGAVKSLPTMAALFAAPRCPSISNLGSALGPDGSETLAMLLGPADDPASAAQAEALAASWEAGRIFGRPLAAGMVAAGAVRWQPSLVGIARKQPGVAEAGGRAAGVLALMVGSGAGDVRFMASLLCACTGTARAIDPEAPDVGALSPLIEAARASSRRFH